jgi:hypothetical protein
MIVDVTVCFPVCEAYGCDRWGCCDGKPERGHNWFPAEGDQTRVVVAGAPAGGDPNA